MIDREIIALMKDNLGKLNINHVKIILIIVVLFGVYGLFANNIRNFMYEQEIRHQFELFAQRYAVDFEKPLCELRSC